MLLAAPTQAERLALENFERNLAALEGRQPRLLSWIEDQPIDGEWVFARDGTLTLRQENRDWLGGCSVPRRLSELQLKALEIRGSVACFLTPKHATDLAVALEKLTGAQAIIALIPSFSDLAAMLHCLDFAEAIGSGRLLFLAGSAWDVELERLFAEQLGLATPSSFIRLPHSDDAIVNPLMDSVQKIIARTNEHRGSQLAQIRETYQPPGQRRVCIVAPMRFRLWNDFGAVIESIQSNAGDLDLTVLDSDSPASAAPHALAVAASRADMLFTMNTARTDLPGVIPTDLPWITWLTGARVPSAALAGDFDRLLLAHPSLQPAALKAGWQADQIQIAGWPTVNTRKAAGRDLSLICDTAPLATPEDLKGYSSHSVLWETIREELLRNPFAMRRVDDYLQKHLQTLGVTDSAFSHSRFVEQLIVPAFVQGLARTLAAANVPFQIFGSGWDAVAEHAARCRGSIKTRDELQAALDASIALVHPLIARAGHPILRSGVPVVAATDARGFVQLAKQALSGRIVQMNDPTPQLNAALLGKLLSEVGNF